METYLFLVEAIMNRIPPTTATDPGIPKPKIPSIISIIPVTKSGGSALTSMIIPAPRTTPKMARTISAIGTVNRIVLMIKSCVTVPSSVKASTK